MNAKDSDSSAAGFRALWSKIHGAQAGVPGKDGVATRGLRPILIRVHEQETLSVPASEELSLAEADDRFAAVLRNQLGLDYPWEPYNRHDLDRILFSLGKALSFDWPPDYDPPLALVRGGDDLALGEPCGPDHPLVHTHLADPQEYLEGELIAGDQKISLLVSPDLAYHSLRWLSPNGDRVILVLSREYEL